MEDAVKREKELRYDVCWWAFLYEVKSDPCVSDSVFDTQCLKIDLSINTGDEIMDKWFRENFTPYTGSWIWGHPLLVLFEGRYNTTAGAGKTK